jgi:hypothetical protein
MALNIQRFMSNMSQKPSARSSHFDVIITSKIGGKSDLTLRAENVSLPGRSVSTTDFFDVGPPRKMGYSAIYGESAISFILSDDYNEKEYFDKWTDVIVGPHRRRKNSGGDRFNAGYYDDYKGTVEIQNYSASGQPTYKTTLIEAWPMIISPVQLDWGSSDFAKLNVTFTYRYYEQRNMAEEFAMTGGLSDGTPTARSRELARYAEEKLMTGGLQDGMGAAAAQQYAAQRLAAASSFEGAAPRSQSTYQLTGGIGFPGPNPTFPNSTVNHTPD